MFRESSCTLYLGKPEPVLVDLQIGTPGSVEFDFDRIWRHRQFANPNAPSDYLLLHVHPPGFGALHSSVDKVFFQAYTKAFGSSPRFGILCFNYQDVHNLEGAYQEYYCTSGGKVRTRYAHHYGIPLAEEFIPNFPGNIRPFIQVLKTLSHVEFIEKVARDDK